MNKYDKIFKSCIIFPFMVTSESTSGQNKAWFASSKLQDLNCVLTSLWRNEWIYAECGWNGRILNKPAMIWRHQESGGAGVRCVWVGALIKNKVNLVCVICLSCRPVNPTATGRQQTSTGRPHFRPSPVPVAMEMTSCCSTGTNGAGANGWEKRDRASDAARTPPPFSHTADWGPGPSSSSSRTRSRRQLPPSVQQLSCETLPHTAATTCVR